MDEKEGFCWRCYNEIRAHRSNMCSSCRKAEYCSNRCLKEDKLRHESVECPTWSMKKCGSCCKLGAKFQCTGCLIMWYCSVECQRLNWDLHKSTCKSWQKKTNEVAQWSKHVIGMEDFPFYFNNAIANDLLNLQCNEMKETEGELPASTTLNILLTACGDLTDVIQTIQSLPSEYKGSLRFVINDIDPFVIARNVLILFMIATFEKENIEAIASIWLSLRLSTKDSNLLQETLQTLIEMDSAFLKQYTNGFIDNNVKSFNVLKDIWTGWKGLPCCIEQRDCAKLDQERNDVVVTNPWAFKVFLGYLKHVPDRHVSSIKKWFEDGVISSKSPTLERPFYNPTFTGHSKVTTLTFGTSNPISLDFHYCIRIDCIPFQMWDYLEMVRLDNHDSVSVMCHKFTTRCITTTMALIKDKRLTMEIFSENFTNLGSVLPKGDQHRFDRIHTSNLIDYHNIREVLTTTVLFLNRENTNAVILVETMNWPQGMGDADYPYDQKTIDELINTAVLDTHMRNIIDDDNIIPINFFNEYYNNMNHFVTYLRGKKIAEFGDSGVKKPMPKWSEVIQWEGLTLRDFNKERNKVVPFCRRVNARAVNMIQGFIRTMEWYIP